jgi:putative CocE/NonD family hydrolase
MRDGVELVADLYRPASREPSATLVQRTPYDKEYAANDELFRFVQAGYAVLVQDTRGRFRSPGVFDPFRHEAADGEDTFSWAAGQEWSTGAVGTIGMSYVGATQWLPAARAPSALRAMAPNVTSDDHYEGWTYQGGAFQLGFCLLWTLLHLALGDVGSRLNGGGAQFEQFEELVAASDGVDALYRHRPLVDMPMLREVAPYYARWLAHPRYDDHWRALAPKERFEQVTAPALNIGGWHDLFLGGTLGNYMGMRDRGGSPAARRPRLVIGPWAHGIPTGQFAERLYGVLSSAQGVDLAGEQIRWFDHHLRGIENRIDMAPPVKVFVSGEDAWRELADWPPPDARVVRYYLRSNGRANTRHGDGGLSPDRPGDEPEDFLRYDPDDPVPTWGGPTFLPGGMIGANAGPRDQRQVEDRPDVLCFTSEALERPLTVIGPIRLRLFASSSALDTDFTAKLVDVHPDGRAESLTDGILRARYRDSLSDPQLLDPGRVYELEIAVGATANTFGAGHRIRLEVSSSNFPRFDRNTNTGGDIARETDEDVCVATNRVYHDAHRPSCLELMVLD